MVEARFFPLESVRTDGWLERIAEGIGSFQALCDILGERFFAFSMITGARITALTVDRRNPDNTLVDFEVSGEEADEGEASSQRLTLADFRRRLVSALVAPEALGEPPARETDLEALQFYIGVRYLLLAPLYGYSLLSLTLAPEGSELHLLQDGAEQRIELDLFRVRLRAHVRQELERVSRNNQRGAIDLARVSEAEEADAEGDFLRVLELLGAWPAPLAIFLRTPEGQMLASDARATIAQGLALLGSACVKLGEIAKGEEVLRLAIQYAGDGPRAGDVFVRLGEAMLNDGRAAEAIGPLRRAANLGAPPQRTWLLLAHAFTARGRFLAALAAIEEAKSVGVERHALVDVEARVEEALGPALTRWRSQLALN